MKELNRLSHIITCNTPHLFLNDFMVTNDMFSRYTHKFFKSRNRYIGYDLIESLRAL
jgi:hypothetical protein